MSQQINFLKTIHKEEPELPGQWVILSIIGALSFVTIISLYMIMHQASTYILLKIAHTKNHQVSTVFQQTATAYPLLAGDVPLAIQITTLEKALGEKKHNFEALTGSALRYGFSNYLNTLAKIVPEGLWIKKLSIDQAKKTATINGYIVKPVDVSILLQALQKSPAFSKTVFNLFYIKDVPVQNYTEFSLTNEIK